jgi:hypothetical protein
MITQVIQSPFVWTPAYSPIIYTVVSNKIQEPRFKYVFKIQPVGGSEITIKVPPSPYTGFGTVDIQKLVQGYLKPGMVNQDSEWDLLVGGAPDDDTANQGDAINLGKTPFNQNTAIALTYGTGAKTGRPLAGEVRVKVGEEYWNGTALVTYTGNSDTAGMPAYQLYARRDSLVNVGTYQTDQHVRFYAGWKAPEEIRTHLYPLGDSYGQHVEVYPNSGNVDFRDRDKVMFDRGLFLQEKPREAGELVHRIQQNDQLTLQWWNFRDNKYWAVDNNAYAGDKYYFYAAKIEFKNAQGVVVGTETVYNQKSTGGVESRATPQDPIGQVDQLTNAIMSMDISPNFLKSWFGSLPTGCTHYTVALHERLNTGNILLGNQISERVTVHLVEADCSGYERVRISWLNKFGGKDYYSFTKKSEQTITAKGDTFYKLPLYNSLGYSGHDVSGYGTTSLGKEITQKWQVMTDWLTNVEAESIISMFHSPLHWAWLKDTAGCPATRVNITDQSVVVKTERKDKLFQYTITFETAQTITSHTL